MSQNIHFKRSERVYKGTFCWDFEFRPKKIKKNHQIWLFEGAEVSQTRKFDHFFFKKKRPGGHKEP